MQLDYTNQVTGCRKVKVGKSLCSLAPLIGQYYGIQFEVPADGDAIQPMKKPR